MIYTFWEGRMPAYIKMCIETWKWSYTLLTYNNLHLYTDLPIDKIKRFTLPQIADCVRVHVLRDHGGYWLDADTIMLNKKLPTENITGYVEERTNTIGFLHTEPHSDMFERWAEHQDKIINSSETSHYWGLMGNDFTDDYIKNHEEITIHPVDNYWAETYMIEGDMPRMEKYKRFYFGSSYELKDLKQEELLMLHNSWTPQWYKDLSKAEVLKRNCTLSNILREVCE